MTSDFPPLWATLTVAGLIGLIVVAPWELLHGKLILPAPFASAICFLTSGIGGYLHLDSWFVFSMLGGGVINLILALLKKNGNSG